MDKMMVAYAHQHIRRPDLPFGGYYALGVCQDAVAAIEKKMTGKVTLFPNTADVTLFDDSRDAEVNTLMRETPNDRSGLPEPERIFGSVPTSDLSAVTIPGLSADLIKVHAAWEDGTLERTPNWIRKIVVQISLLVAVVLATAIMLWRRRRRAKAQQPG
jgi:hypothetical protein